MHTESATQLWDILQGQVLFGAADPSPYNDAYRDEVHLALITALLGPPPKSLLRQGRRTELFYHNDGMKHVGMMVFGG